MMKATDLWNLIDPALLVDKIKSELDSGLTRSEAGSKIFDPGCAGEDEDAFS
jgi:hypothetical protein